MYKLHLTLSLAHKQNVLSRAKRKHSTSTSILKSFRVFNYGVFLKPEHISIIAWTPHTLFATSLIPMTLSGLLLIPS